MIPGDVLRWNAFNLQKGPGPIKPRWFVYLGDNGVFAVPAVLFSVTSTTQLAEYEEGKARAGRKVVQFKASPASPFIQDCLIDVEYDRYEIEASYVATCAADIAHMGSIGAGKTLEIWRIIEGSSRYSPFVKKDIKRCLVKAGFLKG